MNKLLIANILSFITALFTIASAYTKDPHRTYWYQMVQCIIYSFACYFFGVYASIILMLFNATRNGLVAAEKFNKYWCFGLAATAMVLGLLINGGSIAGYVSIFTTVYYTISSYYLKSPVAVKVNVVIDLCLWIIYDIMIIDISSGVVDVIGVIMACITIWRLKHEYNERTSA